MTGHRERVQLTGEQETLLITLYCKTLGCPPNVFEDKMSWKILENIEYDFSRLRVPMGTRLTVCLRAKKMDDYVRQYLARQPRSVMLHLGCGLDSRCTRVDHGESQWYDLDMPDVIDLRKKFFEETDTYHMIPAPVTDLRWIEAIPRQNQAALIVAEGLMMYLPEQEVKSLILRLKETFPGSGLVFDAFSELTARNVKRHPSVKKAGAVVQWGIDDARAIESWAAGIQLKEEWYFSQSEDIKKLASGYRLMFKLAGLFTAARKAHRILYYTL
jgi:O-methyltransferase involved in polyketide biosynthesis